MNIKKLLLAFTLLFLFTTNLKSQLNIDPIAQITQEKSNTTLCYNNTKLMAGNTITDRYIVYFNADTIFLNVNQGGTWTRKIAHTSTTTIVLATMAFYKDTAWVCWKEGLYIKAKYTPNKGVSWSPTYSVSPASNVSAPSIDAGRNGKIHIVWSRKNATDSAIYHNVFKGGSFSVTPTLVSNPTGNGAFPSIATIGDTLLCTWKEDIGNPRVWFCRSFNGGTSWTSPIATYTSGLPTKSKDPNLVYAYDAGTTTHYVYLAYDGNNGKIYFQRSTDFGTTWNSPAVITATNSSNGSKYSQFAHIVANNNGFVGVSFEAARSVTATTKEVGFTYSTSWGNTGSFGSDSVAYTNNIYGSIYPGINKIDENNFYLAWLTNDLGLNKMLVLERRLYFGTNGIKDYQNVSNADIHVFPNPANDLVNIKVNNQKIQFIKIYNQTGELVQESFATTFSISKLPAGLFFIITQTDKSIYINKLVKQ